MNNPLASNTEKLTIRPGEERIALKTFFIPSGGAITGVCLEGSVLLSSCVLVNTCVLSLSTPVNT